MKYDVGIIGLGYVGLTLATALAKNGMSVIGVEKRDEIVNLTNLGIPHFVEIGLEEQLYEVVSQKKLKATKSLDKNDTCDAFIITVGTPLDENGTPRLDMIKAASHEVAKNMKNEALVILRSTVMISTTRNIVYPILSNTGLTFDLAMCPERTLEGNAMEELLTLPQIIGSDSQTALLRASKLFGRLTKSIIKLKNYEAAEIVKLVDNTSRDISFAFANEVARVCESFKVNALDVINSGKLGYPRTNVALPGLVGGPCLEKDPHIFNFSAKKKGIELELTRAARYVNERQPDETLAKIYSEAKKRKFPDNVKIAVLGLAFKGKPETSDLRGSMSLRIVKILHKLFSQANFELFDPVVSTAELLASLPMCKVNKNIWGAVKNAHIIIIANNHSFFSKLNMHKLKEHAFLDAFVYDYWNHFTQYPNIKEDQFYFALGNTRGLG